MKYSKKNTKKAMNEVFDNKIARKGKKMKINMLRMVEIVVSFVVICIIFVC